MRNKTSLFLLVVAAICITGEASIKSVANEDALPLRKSHNNLATSFKELGVSLSATTPATT